MKVQNSSQPSGFDLQGFFARARVAPVRVLMLDYDGTLAPFCDEPTQAMPYAGVVPLLDAIMASPRTRLVIISGRWIKDLRPLLGLQQMPEIWGCHGWERLRPGGDYGTPRVPPKALELLVTADEWADEIEALGARTERKPASVAFHWRGMSNHRIAEIRNRLLEKWMELAQCDDLVWHEFDGGIEVRIAGRDKGDAVRTIVAESGPDAALAYVGDDLTDEDAFRALPPGSASVLMRAEYRPTTAQVWLRPPEQLLQFLRQWHDTVKETA